MSSGYPCATEVPNLLFYDALLKCGPTGDILVTASSPGAALEPVWAVSLGMNHSWLNSRQISSGINLIKAVHSDLTVPIKIHSTDEVRDYFSK